MDEEPVEDTSSEEKVKVELTQGESPNREQLEDVPLEFETKPPSPLQDGTLEEPTSADAAANKDDGTVKNVFTDEEDAIKDKQSSGRKSPANDALVWSRAMTNLLLDLYEAHQKDFASGTHLHRSLWHIIYQKMCAQQPSLRRWTESHVQSKFCGLKRTYRGARDYLKNNQHTTNWPYFERMHKIMQSKYESEEKEQKPSDEPEDASDTPEAKWLQSWTPLLLEAHTALHGTRKRAGHWLRVVARMRRVDARCARLEPARAHREFQELRARAERDALGDDVLQKLAHLEKLEGERQSDTDSPAESAPRRHAGAARPVAPTEWSSEQTSALLTACAKVGAGAGAGAAPARVASALRAALKTASTDADWVTPALVGKQLNKLRRKYNSILEMDLDSTKWPFFKQAEAAFGGQTEAWSRGHTLLLLDLYADVSRELDDSGPKFWTELAKRFNEKNHKKGFQTTHQKCEKRMQALCSRYQCLLQADPNRDNEAKHWFLFEKMQSIFGERDTAQCWPTRTVQMLLAVYQRELPRFEAAEDPQRVWQDISLAITSHYDREAQAELTADDCRDKVTQLKQRYSKLLRDDEAAKAWPLFKRMSELFSSHLWSKYNVNLLLDIYSELKERLEGVPDATATATAWQELSARFNTRSYSSCVTVAQCRAEMHVLRARHRALLLSTSPVRWPFLQRMKEIFGSELKTPTVRTNKKQPKVKNGDSKKDTIQTEYTWSDEATHRLLELYLEHKPQFDTQPRRLVWQRITDALAAHDPQYSPGKKGAGAWFKYLDIMTKYMDIKEKRIEERDWPFYDRMEAILGKLGTAADAVSEASEASDASPRQGSPVAELEAILCAPAPRSRKRMIGSTEFAGVFIKESKQESTEPKQESTEPKQESTEPKRKKDEVRVTPEPLEADAAAGTTEEERNSHLLELYSKHRLLLHTDSTSETIHRSKQKAWQRIAKQMQCFDPLFESSSEDCQQRVDSLLMTYKKMKINHCLVPVAQRLSVQMYQKVESIVEQEKEERDLIQSNLTNGANSDVLEALLKEIRRKNDLSEKRNGLIQKQQEEKRQHHKESMDMMKNILKALSNPAGETDPGDVLNMLEKTMEEIHK